MLEGLRFLRNHRDVAVYASVKALWSLGGGVILVLPLFGHQVLPLGKGGAVKHRAPVHGPGGWGAGASGRELSLAMAAVFALGAVAMGVLLRRRCQRVRRRRRVGGRRPASRDAWRTRTS